MSLDFSLFELIFSRVVCLSSPDSSIMFEKTTIDVEPQNNANKGWSMLLLVTAISTTLGLSLSVGFNIGVVNAPAEIIKNFCNESIYTRFDVTLSDGGLQLLWSAIVSIYLIGGAVGSLTGSWLADSMGRKGAISISTALATIAGLLFFTTKFANYVELLLLGRLLVGLAAGLITCIVPMYLIELAPLNLRGAMGVLCPLGINCGILLAQIISLNQILGTEEYWPYLLSCYTILVLLFGVVLPVLPESPKYLLFVKKRPQTAIECLSRIRNLPESALQEEIREMLLAAKVAQEERTHKMGFLNVITDRTLMLPLLLVCSMQTGQQFSGINAVFYYSVSIFMEAGLSEMNSQLATIGSGAINLLMAFLSIAIMSRFGRRPIMQFSCFSAAACLLVLTLTITYINAFSWMPYLCIAAVLSYVFCYGIGLGPIPYFIGSELFEVAPRSTAMALGSMANWGGNFLIGLTFPVMQGSIGAGSFLIFATTTLFLFLFIRYYLPETKDRDPLEISAICKNGLRSRVLDSLVNSTVADTTISADEFRSV